MVRAFAAMIFLCVSAMAGQAQQSWVQVEAQPNLRQAELRARAYASAFSNVVGYQLSTGWYAVALGPYASADDARQALLSLRRDRVIPRDSYLSDGAGYGPQFWPVGAAIGVQPSAPEAPGAAPATETVTDTETETETETAAPASDPVTQPAPAPALAPAPAALDETPREARASEQDLTREDRRALQTAMQWFGFYTSTIDGAFGRGTRAAMGRWQQANAFDATGVLTTRQRALLLEQYDSALAALGLGPLVERKAGIEITMPTGLVEFAGYDYPFVRYREKDGSGVQVLLISQAGDEATLGGLYEIMQTLEIVPVDGERRKRTDSFTLRGVSDRVESYTFARLGGGYVKGFTLVYPPARASDMARVIEIMQDSFTTREGALEATDSNEEGQSVDLLAGLELRQPKTARSGFYVDRSGQVVTVAEAVDSCERITIDDTYEAELVAAGDGLALIRPLEQLVPLGFARLAPNPGLLRSTIAVSGYSYEGALGAPTVTYGTLEDLRGLTGDDRLKRLEVRTLPGDVGGPVFDDSGAVSGILLPNMVQERALPDGTGFAIKSTEVARFLSENGVSAAASTAGPQLAAEELSLIARDMTVLISCW